jgi:hypothetical protein
MLFPLIIIDIIFFSDIPLLFVNFMMVVLITTGSHDTEFSLE